MGRIKSAWEIALEKTESIEVDENKIRHNADIDAIRRKAGAYLLGEEDTEDSLRSELSKYGKDEIKEALGQTIINSLTRPQTDMTESKKPQRLFFLLSLALPGNQEVLDFLQDVLNHMAQYPRHREQMMDQLKSQFEPMLREKEEKMRAQYGECPHLTFENDKECREMANKYLERLRDQYQKTLDDAKEQLKEVLK